MALMKDPITGKIVPVPPSISVPSVTTDEKKEEVVVTKEDVKVVPSTPVSKPLIEKRDPVVANLPKEVQPLVEREIEKRRVEFVGTVDRSSQVAKIKVVLSQHGMDSQQQEKALQEIRAILEG